MGLTVHAHYCMGHIVSVSLEADDHDACSNCGMKKKERKGCCSDEHKTFKTADHRLAPADYKLIAAAPAPAILPQQPAIPQSCPLGLSAADIVSRVYHSPPRHSASCPLFIYIRNLRV